MGFMDLFKKKKRNDKYRIGMEKTRKGSFARLKRLFTGYNEVTEEFFDELEEIFVMADIGVDTTVKFIDELKADPRVKAIKDIREIQPIIIDKMFDLYLKGEIVNSNLRLNKSGLSVFLFVGVNGSGKTTTIAKIAHKLRNEGKKVVVAAGDTFRRRRRATGDLGRARRCARGHARSRQRPLERDLRRHQGREGGKL